MAGAVLLGFAVSDYSDSRDARGEDAGKTTPVLPAEVASKAQRWNWSQSTGESSRVEIFADSYSQNSAGGQIDLYGVELQIFHEAGAAYDRVVSETAVFSLGEGKLFSEGETIITLGVPTNGVAESRTKITTSGVTFYTKSNQANTDQPAAYEFDGGRGSSVGAVYESGSGVFHMKSAVYLERFATVAGQAPTRIHAGSLYYHEHDGRIDLHNGVKVERGSQWLESADGVVRLYEGAVRKIEANQAVGGERAESRQLSFETPRFEAYYSENQVLERLHGYGTTTFTSDNKLQKLNVNGDRMVLFYRSIDDGQDSELERVDVRDSSRVQVDPHGKGTRRTITSEVIELRMRPGGDAIERVETHEPGHVELIPVGTPGGRRTLDAARIRLDYGDSNRMEKLTATGDVELLREPAKTGAPALQTWSSALEAGFSPDSGEMTSLRQWEGFRFVEGERRGKAGEGKFDVAANLLDLSGKAEVLDAAGRVTAHHIVLDQTSKRLVAEIGVTSVFSGEPAKQSTEGGGLFAQGDPVYATAAKMLSYQDSGIIEYHGQARLWQADNRVEAEHITIDRTSRVLTASDRVVTGLTEASTEGQPMSNVTVFSSDLRYDEASRTAEFDGQVDFRRQGLQVISDQLTALLAEKGSDAGTIESATANGSVKISETVGAAGRRGLGQRAVYDPGKSEVVLTGQPARVLSADGDETRGAELIYLVDDDRLQVSGRGAERAYTYRRGKK